jgi:hypothetical protein
MPEQTLLADLLLDRLPNGSEAVFDREYRYVFAGGRGCAPPDCRPNT